MTFKDYIRKYDSTALMMINLSESHHNALRDVWGVNTLFGDAVIEPERVSLPHLDISSLNQFYDDIAFTRDLDKNNYQAKYDPATGQIEVTFGTNVRKSEVEAILTHEIIHKQQESRSNNKFSEQQGRIVQKINQLSKQINTSVNITKKRELTKLRNDLLRHFSYETPYEKMAYAYQYVKLRRNFKLRSPVDVIDQMKKDGHTVDNKLKKYIFMYWEIRKKL